MRVWGAYWYDPDPCGTAESTVDQGVDCPSAFSVASDCGGWAQARVLFADGFERGDRSRWD